MHSFLINFLFSKLVPIVTLREFLILYTSIVLTIIPLFASFKKIFFEFFLILSKLISKDDEVIVPEYSFIIYRMYSKLYGAKVHFAKEKNYTISIKNILSKVTRKTKIVFLANPNNPTGTLISRHDLLNLRKIEK